MWLSLIVAFPMTTRDFTLGFGLGGNTLGTHQDLSLGRRGAEALAKTPQLPPCSPAPRNFQAHSAASAKVDLVSINKGIIARETWLRDGPCPITAVAGLRQLLPCNYPTAAQPSTFYS